MRTYLMIAGLCSALALSGAALAGDQGMGQSSGGTVDGASNDRNSGTRSSDGGDFWSQFYSSGETGKQNTTCQCSKGNYNSPGETGTGMGY